MVAAPAGGAALVEVPAARGELLRLVDGPAAPGAALPVGRHDLGRVGEVERLVALPEPLEETLFAEDSAVWRLEGIDQGGVELGLAAVAVEALLVVDAALGRADALQVEHFASALFAAVLALLD